MLKISRINLKIHIKFTVNIEQISEKCWLKFIIFTKISGQKDGEGEEGLYPNIDVKILK